MLNDSARTWYGRIDQHALPNSHNILVIRSSLPGTFWMVFPGLA